MADNQKTGEMMDVVYQMHELMLKTKTILVYEGEFTQEITKSVLSMTERNMESIGEEFSIKRKVFNVMVECLQNIVKHSEEYITEDKRTNAAIFMIGKDRDAYVIVSGNPVRKSDVELLRSRLEKINSLDKDGLKALYKEIIQSDSGLTDRGGAGLGFVDMARKSGQKLEFSFYPLDENYSFFTLKTTVARA